MAPWSPRARFLLFWLCCGKPGKEKLYVYQVPDLPMKQVEVAFRA